MRKNEERSIHFLYNSPLWKA